MSNEANSSTIKPKLPPFIALKSPFIRRTALATVVTASLVGATATVYIDPAWATRYWLAAMWALVFFALTPLIIKALLFEQRVMTGLGLIAFKLFWMALIIVACTRFSGGSVSSGSALIAGISTPLAVIVLRALGGGLRNAARSSTGAAAAGSTGRSVVKESH